MHFIHPEQFDYSARLLPPYITAQKLSPDLPPDAIQYIQDHLITDKLTQAYYTVSRNRALRDTLTTLVDQGLPISNNWDIGSPTPDNLFYFVYDLLDFLGSFENNFKQSTLVAAIQHCLDHLTAIPTDSATATVALHGAIDVNNNRLTGFALQETTRKYLSGRLWYTRLYNAHESLAPANPSDTDFYNACTELLILDQIQPGWITNCFD